MRIVIPGGTGQVGRVLRRAFAAHDVIVVSRRGGDVRWDGPWEAAIDGADVVINLAGRSVNCRYTRANLREMMDSRIHTTRIVGAAIGRARRPPRVWLQMSTATIYAHTFGAPNDERTGVIGGHEPDVPPYWRTSIDIATEWERTQREAFTPCTRRVALRSAMVMSRDRGGVFDTLLRLTRWGLGGALAGGRQYVSWIHERDFARAVAFLIEREDFHGPVNLAAPNPLPQREFAAALRAAWGARIGLPASKWMLEIGAFLLRTDTELILKSRRVVPGRLLDAGFTFDFPQWRDAARDLVSRA
jgi:uncharacterized protein